MPSNEWKLSAYPPSLHLLKSKEYQIGETPLEPLPDHHACPDSFPSGTKFCIILKIPLEYIYPNQYKQFKVLSSIDFDVCRVLAKNFLETCNDFFLLDAEHEFVTHCILIKLISYSWHPKLHAVAPGALIPTITVYNSTLVQEWLQM